MVQDFDLEIYQIHLSTHSYEWFLPVAAPIHPQYPLTHPGNLTDSIEFLKNFSKKIDFLYLDGWDKGAYEYAERHLEAFLAAQDKLADLHIVSIDDTDFDTESAGKDRLLTPHLLENGYIKVLWGRQTVFIKNKY